TRTFTRTPTGTPPTATDTPAGLTPTNTPTPPKVDIILGQAYAGGFECNSQRVSWDPNLVKLATVTPVTNSIEKPTAGPVGWNAGAVSSQSLDQGLGQDFVTGYVEVTADQANTTRAFGLSHAQTGWGLEDLDYGIVLSNTAAL